MNDKILQSAIAAAAPAEEPLIVLTYPGHFMLTALTMQSYLQHHAPCDITVIVDDVSNHAWPQYADDCENLYQQKIVLASSVDCVRTQRNGWIRQQLLKLYLDQLTNFSSWFFTDGDIVFRYPAPKRTIPYCITRGGPVQQMQNSFVKHMLDLTEVGIYAQHRVIVWAPNNTAQVCVSNPPFRSMQSRDLVDLRAYIEKLHNRPFDQIWNSCVDEHGHAAVSEWELLENFKTYVQQSPSELTYYPTCAKDHTKTKQSEPDFCEHHFLSDAEYGRDELAKFNIKVTDQIWQHLEKISR
jgi:hypothetical protein